MQKFSAPVGVTERVRRDSVGDWRVVRKKIRFSETKQCSKYGEASKGTGKED